MSHGQEIRRWERCERGGVLVFASHRSQTFGGWMFLALQSLDIIVTAGVPFHSESSSLIGTGCRLTQYQARERFPTALPLLFRLLANGQGRCDMLVMRSTCR